MRVRFSIDASVEYDGTTLQEIQTHLARQFEGKSVKSDDGTTTIDLDTIWGARYATILPTTFGAEEDEK